MKDIDDNIYSLITYEQPCELLTDIRTFYCFIEPYFDTGVC